MVLVVLRGLRDLRTKIARPPTLFPPPQPRSQVLGFKSVRTYYERSKKKSKSISLVSKLNVKTPRATYSVFYHGLACARALWPRILEASCLFSRALSPAAGGFPLSAQTGLLPSSLLIARLVSLIAAGEVHLLWRRRGLGDSVLRVQVGLAYIQAVPFGRLTCACMRNWSPFIHLAGIIWGLWIAGFAKYSPDLWGQSCQVTAFYVWQDVDFLLLRAICNGNVSDGNVGHGSFADQLLGNSVGAIESVACAIIAFSLDRAATWNASASSCLVQLAPFGGSALEFRLSGLG
jgi:hypothetical protein